MTAALSLSNLPVEVITNTFKCMDRPSLQSCCLVSHDFNEIATPVLYRSLIVEVALQQSIDPFRAFERRPQLYRAVQTVKFVDKSRWKGGNWRYLKDEEFEPIVKHLSLCRSDLALDFAGVQIYVARQYYHNILKKLDNVEELCLNWRYLFDFEGLPSRLRRISIVNLPIRERAENWLKSRNNTLEELILPTASSNLRFLSGFTALRKFWVRNIQSWESFVAAARSMKRLEDITFSVEKYELKLTKVALDPLSLPRLHSLNVTIYGCRKPPLVDTIYYVYETLAVSSKVVENLRIKIWYSDRIHQYEGGKLARLIAHNHGSTIRSLIIDDMILSSENLGYLCLQCPNLETLGFGVPKPTIMMGLSTPLNRLNSLSYLRLTVNSEHSARAPSECFHLMKQDLPQLRLLHLRLYDKGRSMDQLDYTLWKKYWSYDQGTNSIEMTKSTRMNVWDDTNL